MFSYLTTLLSDMKALERVLFILISVVFIHLAVMSIRRFSRRWMLLRLSPRLSKSRTIGSLLTSGIVFLLYFWGLGLILGEFGVSLKAYLASASILGLAIGFGSQGLVQDVVNGLTIVFSGLYNIGDMVEVSGQTGVVRSFGMRFTVIESAFGAMIYIPNRTVSNVIRYPKGYIRGLADITLPDDPEKARRIEERVSALVTATSEQLPGILVAPPTIEGRIKTSTGKEFLRVKFRLWPGRGAPIETIFKQEVVSDLKELEPTYQDWMVTVNYEVERRVLSL
jgi:small conductance mechanosensitive channel